ncbi:MAG: thiolase C-terminal domain-containing protein [Nitrososphaerales archaeon]
MTDGVGIIGVGYEGFRPAITDLSTRELMYQAASKAYGDAEIDPRREIGSFICCTEDLWEGWSIADEMVPDQVGGARRPVCTVPGDGIIGMGHAVMHIRSGVADVVSVEAHSKVADVLEKTRVENLALDPQFHRVTGANGDVLAGLEMSAFMKSAGLGRDDVSLAVQTEKEKATRNTRASYGTTLELSEIGEAEAIAAPLRRYDRSDYAEAGIVLVLASERWIKSNKKEAVLIDGLAWRSSTPWFEGGGVESARYAKDSFESARKQGGFKGIEGFDILEVDDTYSFKLLQHLMSLGVNKPSAMKMLEEKTRRLNPSGGSLGTGYLIEANGSHKVLECVLQMRGQAGGNQVRGVERALAVSWRGNPTATGAAVALSVES